MVGTLRFYSPFHRLTITNATMVPQHLQEEKSQYQPEILVSISSAAQSVKVQED
jgi:hypothetical protein